MSALVFATSLIDNNPQRYQGWIDYYTDFFYGLDLKLMLFNDGPVATKLDLKEAEVVEILPHLGRQHVWKFPGWKRSFYYGLKTAREKKFQRVAHIESDCFVTLDGREEFLSFLYSPGFYTPFCKSYNFPETALQIINEPWVMNYYIDRYSCEDNWYEELDFESLVQQNLNPQIIMNGDRYEGKSERLHPDYNFISGCNADEFFEIVSNNG